MVTPVTEATITEVTGETVAPITETTIPDTSGKMVTPVTEATITEVTGETVAPITETTIPDTSGKMVTPVTEATITEVTGETVAPITETTIPDTSGKMVTPVTEATITEAAGETVATILDKLGKTVAPVTKATIPVMTTTIVLGHKEISTSGLPSVKSFSSSTMKISRESTLFFKSTAKQLTLEDNMLVKSNSNNPTSGPVMTENEEIIMNVTTPDEVGEKKAPITEEASPEKERQSSGLALGLGIFFGMLLITAIIICYCLWKKSRKSSFDVNSVETTIPLNSTETKEPSSDGEKK
ncbi:mucin-4-like isoform X6 [Gopherus flavomarginatus]|nr:mucin-4-like isoform X6 [Gopherus flavomarginatus]